MIMTVLELKALCTATEVLNATDALLETKLRAVENLIRKYTNNSFQNRNVRFEGEITSGSLVGYHSVLAVGDSVQISESKYNDGIYVISEISDGTITVSETLHDEGHCLVTLVKYPSDIKAGVAAMIEWNMTTGTKVGVQSETLSRHSVTYFNMDGDNSSLGYPKSLTGFLKPYIKARF